VALNPSGDVLVTGETQSSNFPTTSSALQPVLPGSDAAFVTRLAQNATSPTPTPTPTATAIVSTGSTYATTILADKPVGYWRLGESSGSVAVDQTGAHNGTYVNAPVLGQPGALANDTNTAVKFDGVSSHVSLGDTLDFPNTAAFSLETWVNPSLLDGTVRRVISKDNSSDGFLLGVSSSTTAFVRYAGGSFDQTPNAGVLPTGVWSHIVATYDGATMRVFINGVQVSSLASSRLLSNNTNSLTFADRASGGRAFNGVLDEVAIYNVALSPAQIQAHFTAGHGG
jgi:hypothetical protein